MTLPLQFASLYDGQGIFVWSDCQLNLGTDFLVGNIIFVRDAQYLAVAPHFHGLYFSLKLCCEGPYFISIQEDGCHGMSLNLQQTHHHSPEGSPFQHHK